MSRIFLSHSSRDNRYAVALKHWLERVDPGLAGEIFLDLDRASGIRTGTRWTDALWQANARCEAVICLVSESWVASKECHAEFRQAEGMRKPIFCARLESVDGDDVTRAWQSCDLFGSGASTTIAVDGGPEVRLATDGLNRLLTGLRSVGIGADSFPWPPPGDPGRSPYRGWEPLESVDAAVYFGRDAQIVRALDELRGMREAGLERMFVILGPSGVGKSSFLRAGLLPRLTRDDRRFLTMPVVRPERHALTGDTGLARSVHGLRTQVGLTTPGLGEIRNAIGDPDSVRRLLLEAVAAVRVRMPGSADTDRPPTLVLPVDQAEEWFGVDAGQEGPAFLEILGRLLNDAGEGLDLVVVATIRSDRYEPLQTAPQLSDVQSHLFDRLKPMPAAQFAEVIEGPARRAAESGSKFAISPELVDRLIEDASGGADTLPLLALTLARLYEDYAGTGDAVTVDNYEAMGGMRRVVQNEIDSLLSSDPGERSEQLCRLHDAFIPWLATVNSDTDQPMRRIARWSDLPENSHALLNEFVARRLLVKGDSDGQVVVEVALESLLRQWDELADWLRAEAAELRGADAVERAVVAWERSGRRDDWLLDGARLAEAENLSTRPGFGARLNPAGEFLLAARRHANHKLETEKREAQAHARSLRRRSQILAALLGVIVLVAVFAVISQRNALAAEKRANEQARQAVAAKLALESRAMLGGTRAGGERRAILEMVAADRLAPGGDPGALVDTLNDSAPLLKVIKSPAKVNTFAISPDEQVIVSADEDHMLRRWDFHTGEPIGEPLRGHTDNVESLAITKDWIASGAGDRTARIWDAKTGKEIRSITVPEVVWHVALSPDGTLLATATRDGIVQLWTVLAGEAVGEPISAHGGMPIGALEFSPDGKLLATGGFDGAVRLWDVATQRPAAQVVPGQEGMVSGVQFMPDGRRIASASYMNNYADTSGRATQLRVTELATGRTVVDLTEPGYGALSLAVSPDGKRVAIGEDDKTIRVHDAETGAAVGAPITGRSGNASVLAYSPGGTRIVSNGDFVHVWAADPDQSVGKSLDIFALAGPTALSPDGRTMATRYDDKVTDVALWNVDTGELIRTIPTGHTGHVTALAWRADGKAIASSGKDDRSVRVWSADSGEPLGSPLAGATSLIVVLAFSPDGDRIVAGTADGSAWLWDLTEQQPGGGTQLKGNVSAVTIVGFSADGRRVLAATQTHPESGDSSALETTSNVFTLSQRVTASSAQVWDADTGEPAGPMLTGRGGRPGEFAFASDHLPISAAAISPDGRHVLLGTSGNLQLYDVASGKPDGDPWVTPERSAQSGTAVAFSPDGRYAVSADAYSTNIHLWDVGARRPIGKPLTGHATRILRVGFGADGKSIQSWGELNLWMVWPAPSGWADELCSKVAADMTEAEWDEWVSADMDYQEPCR
ncbi:TIR domain-containing protein [Mycolicibacterium farcinogenes]|uniref:nSTAND1 domain-containing NTPase n=1 Tax=Mycolicibacterium farcinogenes TaxID=1802 RepID=UPI001C8EE13B|nr:TIR domain-containing protein [Mycolicibacterium farcinogenes]QZH62504.1 TIR domain-containing protein [Mycolicibacterium farcinogenes]